LLRKMFDIEFPAKPASIRRQQGFSQQRLAIALSVSINTLIFDKEERDPSDDLEAVSQIDPKDRKLFREILEGLILKSEAKQWARSA